MSVVVIEPCEKKISNRFELIDIAAKRARSLDYQVNNTDHSNSVMTSKNTVRALMEIAEGKLDQHINSESASLDDITKDEPAE
jgi:DNA-directed RNA polymerase omega subunit